MIMISRKMSYFHSLKYLACIQRTLHSGRTPHFLSNFALKNTNNDDNNRTGYGEKEIFLLGPIDMRTPLPGNIGVPPLSMLYTDKIRQLPKSAGENCEVTTCQLPEERYHSVLTQAACIAAENAINPHLKLECAAYECPQLLKNDFSDLFPSKDLSNDNLTVLTLCQKTKNDMSEWSEKAEVERENLETSFLNAANALCAYLKCFDYWADFIHPNSGKPNFGPLITSSMFETDLRYRHFGFNIEDLGCCRIISHVKWGTHIFVGAIFTNAAVDSREVQDILDRHNLGKNSFRSSEK